APPSIMNRMAGAMIAIWAIPTRPADSWSTTVTSHVNTMFCMPQLANHEAMPARYQAKARGASAIAHHLLARPAAAARAVASALQGSWGAVSESAGYVAEDGRPRSGGDRRRSLLLLLTLLRTNRTPCRSRPRGRAGRFLGEPAGMIACGWLPVFPPEET